MILFEASNRHKISGNVDSSVPARNMSDKSSFIKLVGIRSKVKKKRKMKIKLQNVFALLLYTCCSPTLVAVWWEKLIVGFEGRLILERLSRDY